MRVTEESKQFIGDLLENDGDSLKHYGVMGMHWGVRKNRSGVRTGRPTAHREADHEDAVRAKAIRAKVRRSGVDSLSNAELQALIQRMNLEGQYGNMSARSKNAGRKFIEDITVSTVKNVTAEYAKAGVKKGVEFGVHKAMEKAKKK